MQKVVIIQGSLNPKSKTAIVAQEAEKILHRFDGIDCQILDLRYFEIQFCDGRKLQDYSSDTKKVYEMIQESHALIIGMPVGFVACPESKEELTKRSTPYISILGRRGGSSAAAATVNALLDLMGTHQEAL